MKSWARGCFRTGPVGRETQHAAVGNFTVRLVVDGRRGSGPGTVGGTRYRGGDGRATQGPQGARPAFIPWNLGTTGGEGRIDRRAGGGQWGPWGGAGGDSRGPVCMPTVSGEKAGVGLCVK